MSTYYGCHRDAVISYGARCAVLQQPTSLTTLHSTYVASSIPQKLFVQI